MWVMLAPSMKTKGFLISAAFVLVAVSSSFAGGRCGGGWGGGWSGPGFYGPGWGGWGPSFGGGFYSAPVVYRTVYVESPRPIPSYVKYEQPTVARAQVRLARLGYYPGPIDGDFGPMTRAAIQTYQSDYGLPVTGRLDRRTVSSLGV